MGIFSFLSRKNDNPDSAINTVARTGESTRPTQAITEADRERQREISRATAAKIDAIEMEMASDIFNQPEPAWGSPQPHHVIQATGATLTLGDNRIAGDVLTISNSGASFADKNAGANKTVTVNGIALGGADAGNYIVNTTATTTASITQAALGVKVDNAEKDQGRANPAFTASYTGLLGGDTLANEVSGSLAFTTPATTGSPSGSYVVSAAGQASTNYALTYTPGVLTVNPTEALQSAVASVLATVNVAPSQGNMVQAEVVAKGETVTSKEDAVQVAVCPGFPGLRLGQRRFHADRGTFRTRYRRRGDDDLSVRNSVAPVPRTGGKPGMGSVD